LEHLDLVPCDDTGSELILCEVPARFSWNLFFPKEADGSDNLFIPIDATPDARVAALPYLGPASCRVQEAARVSDRS